MIILHTQAIPLVHLGIDPSFRQMYYNFSHETEKKFCKHFPPLKEWCRRHEKHEDDPYKIAAGIYVRILAYPQLFIDGNHRSGALIANNYLISRGCMPFVLSCENAITFFNLASDIKFKKEDFNSKFKRAVGWKDELVQMRAFLKDNVRPFLTDKFPEFEIPQIDQDKDTRKNIFSFRHNPQGLCRE